MALATALVLVAPAEARAVADWHALIAEASLRYGIPERWIERVMRAESGGRTTFGGRPIRSPAGAIGLMQLMPGTWSAMRASEHLGQDPDDPHDNILAGTAYLRSLYERFGYPGLFAAYHAGPGRYARYLAGRAVLPAATRTYLARVTGRRANDLLVDADLRSRDNDREAAAPPPDPLFAVRGDAGPEDAAAPSERRERGMFVALSTR